MKRKTLLALAVLLTALACLFTSCSASVEPPKAEEEFGYVTFGNGGSRSLTTEYGIKSYDELYWYYTAVKKDSYGLTGQKLTQTEVPAKTEDGKGIGSGTVGPFSQGAWEFELFAYDAVITGTEADNLVYQGKSATIVLKGGETKAVPVSVSLMGNTGILDFSGACFKWEESGTGDVYLRINIAGTADDSTSVDETYIQMVTSSNGYIMPQYLNFSFGEGVFPAGYYTCTVQAYVLEDFVDNNSSNALKSDSTYKASQSFGLRVYGNAVTRVKDYIEEGLFADVIFDVAKQDMKVFVPNDNGSATINNISVTPSGGAGKTTSVTFSEGALSDVNDATLQLDVKVTPVESSNEKFNINGVDSDNKSAFAGIDVTLWATDTAGTANAVSSFANGTYATVTTYIAKGLENVSVKYKGTDKDQPIATDSTEEGVDKTFAAVLDTDEGNALGYNPSTGLLRFKTNHFSEYYVLADCVALNETKNIGYASLLDAINAAEKGNKIVLARNYLVPATDDLINGVTYLLPADSVLDLNGFTLNVPKMAAVFDGKNITIQNGTINTLDVQVDYSIWLGNGSFLEDNELSSIKLNNINSNAGANIWCAIVEFNDCNINSETKTYYSVWSDTNSYVTINSGTYLAKDSSYAVYISKSNNHIIINGGIFNGRIGISSAYPDYGYSLDVFGGTFTSNPSDYVVSGYGCRLTADGKYEVVSTRDAGYVNNPLPTGPTKNGDVWTVTPVNAQFTLDGAYGSIDGKTIILSEGEYDQLEFGRATKYAGSNTGYYIGGISEENEKTFDEFYAIKNSGSWSASAYYMRNISNVTLKAAEGTTVTIHGLVASSGHVYGNVYDYVLDKAYTSGSAYYLSQNISNITFENIRFDAKVDIATSSADTNIDGVKFKNCSFTTGGTESANGQGLRYYNESNNGKVKNLTVESCTFINCYQGIYTQKINGVTVTDSSFDTTGHNAIAVQSGSGAVNHKAVVITGNTFSNIRDRIIRFGDVASDTQITIKNNTATNSGDSSGQIMKAQSLAKGVTYDISGNNWGEGKTVANPELAD
ncbi:MAG: right-handed parallel beta-helix repeat-containing protein [Spirochaetales bacterium]|nr:right-handed parallel beta-helix repeat-containing protein [Spirochaetales bacterium]